ncbi:MAG: hypothetical protein J6U04_01125 [Salinivirgaceae bacterium]|nr:hypothetical protein [Salinivirgaceae bacterium]
MKWVLSVMFICCLNIELFSQQLDFIQFSNVNHNVGTTVVFKLYPTANVYTYLKLDTRSGVLSQVHYAINEDADEAEVLLGKPLYIQGDSTNMVAGRFELYPTKNMWTFILLDQIYGDTWHIQWHMDKEKRSVNRIWKTID